MTWLFDMHVLHKVYSYISSQSTIFCGQYNTTTVEGAVVPNSMGSGLLGR